MQVTAEMRKAERVKTLRAASVELNDKYSGSMAAGDATLDRDQYSRDRTELGDRVALRLLTVPSLPLPRQETD